MNQPILPKVCQDKDGKFGLITDEENLARQEWHSDTNDSKENRRRE